MKRQSSILIQGADSSTASQILPPKRDNDNKVRDELRTPLISVIIPCYQQADFLSGAIESVRSQSYHCVEIVVVDDGSNDHTSEVARRYVGVHYIRQNHRGLAAARNTGIRKSRGTYLVFLDADDRLLPNALAAGRQCFREHPECAFVSGDHRRIAFDGSVLEKPATQSVDKDHYLALLRGNYIGMHATVMYRREALEFAGGFDNSLPVCEDYDLFLRLARSFPVSCHQQIVAEYHLHGKNMSRNIELMLKTVLAVLRSQRQEIKRDKSRRQAYSLGIRAWKEHYSHELIRQVKTHLQSNSEIGQAARKMIALLRYAPLCFVKYTTKYVRPASLKSLRAALPGAIVRWSHAHRHDSKYPPAVSRVSFGDLRRVTPISRIFGFDRGLPIDRQYIEAFLALHANDIKGRVLEIGDNSYTRRFGGDRVDKSDVLHVSNGNPLATFVGDLTNADHIPSHLFDCIILTQTLQLIYDVRAAMATLYRILMPGGVLLATFPGISQIEHGEWGRSWYWNFTAQSARRLFEEVFPSASVEVKTHGNVLTAVAFLHGLAATELQKEEFDYHDPDYQLLITARATKPETKG